FIVADERGLFKPQILGLCEQATRLLPSKRPEHLRSLVVLAPVRVGDDVVDVDDLALVGRDFPYFGSGEVVRERSGLTLELLTKARIAGVDLLRFDAPPVVMEA